MRIRAYLAVYGDEPTIRVINEKTNIAHARIKQHTKVRAQWSPTGKDKPWSWRTPRVPIDIDNPDAELKVLLSTHRSIFPVIKKYQTPTMDIALVIITQYDEGEDPRGLNLSAETVLLLSELGAALQNDVVTLMEDSAQND